MEEIGTIEDKYNEEFQDNHAQSIILKEKDGITISRTFEGNYDINFEMTQLLHMPSFIDFSMFKIIMDLNKDIFETSNIDIVSNNEAVITVKFKQYLSDLGIQSLNQCLRIIKMHEVIDGEIRKTVFHINTIVDDNNIISGTLQNSSFVECTFLTNNTVSININQSTTNDIILPFAERMGVNVSGKIISRLKQFIENMGNI